MAPVSPNTSTKIPSSNGTSYNTPSTPSEDRYAALKDLDSMMKQATLKDETISNKSPWNLKDINNGNKKKNLFKNSLN